jgi:hypothetical protein
MVGTAWSSHERRNFSAPDADRPIHRGFRLSRRKARHRDRRRAALRIKTRAARRSSRCLSRQQRLSCSALQQSRCHDQPRGRSRNDCSCRRPCPLPDSPAEVGFIRLRPVNTRRTRVNPSSDASGGGNASGASAAPNARPERANRRQDRRPSRLRTTKGEHCQACRSSGERRIMASTRPAG